MRNAGKRTKSGRVGALTARTALMLVLLFGLLAGCAGSAGNTGSENTGSEESAENAENADSDGHQAAAEEFHIAVIPAQNQGDMQLAMNKLADILREKLNRDVTINVYPDYNGVVEAMNFGQVDMAYFGPLTYVIAHHQSGAEAIVTQLIKGEPFYYSYIITHKDHPWSSLDELLADPSRISFAFGDINSTSGSLIPGIELKARGVYTDEQTHRFKELRFTGSHDVTALAVQNKQVDAGAIDSAIYDSLIEQGKIDGDAFKIIWQSEKLFQYPWAVKKGTDEETIRLLREAFLGVQDEDVLHAFGASGFTEASDADYETIRQAAEQEGKLE